MEKATVTVKYNLYRLDGEYRLSTPKTKSSARVVALSPQAVKLLQEQREWQDRRRKEVGDKWIDREAVFTGQFGEYMSKNYINLQFKRLLKKHDFPDIHIHDLRHPYVKHKTKSFLRNSRVFKADFCAPSHSLCTEVFHFPDNINLISGVNIHTFNQCVSQGGI